MVIADTAGRLHNKANLMAELSKISRRVKKASPEASLETLLVLDAITGQNAISQAKEFCKAADATGIILTKLDGTAKGGCVVAVKQRLGLPVRFIGVGEGFDTVGDEAKGIAADNCVTVRDRDTMEQVRMPISELKAYIESKIEF